MTQGNATQTVGIGWSNAVFPTYIRVFATFFPVSKDRSTVFGTDFMDDEPESPILATLIMVNVAEIAVNATIGAVGETSGTAVEGLAPSLAGVHPDGSERPRRRATV